jgi:4-alpha-glucanotransferase
MTLKNRSSGVLMHISSLPGDFGIGTLGWEAQNFVDLLAQMEFSYWQILPTGPIDSCFSPYKSTSAFAGNPLFIDLDLLHQWGLLTASELLTFHATDSPHSVHYPHLIENRNRVFKLAYSRLTSNHKNEMAKFCSANQDWLPDFCLYTVLSQIYEENDWTKWGNRELIHRNKTALLEAQIKYSDEINFQIFLQFAYAKQWAALKKYANSRGIKIIGDMPIYVAHTSADVWCHPELFQLDNSGNPTAVAGVPPDYFSKDGQLWGNPLYRWDVMKSNQYAWWMQRIKKALDQYDTVRIDHFRAFSAFWSVPAAATTAKNGQWHPGPGMDFFDQLFHSFTNPSIIAEDLGVQDQSLVSLLTETGFPGMRIMEFAFIDNFNNIHLPHNYTANTVAYSGTHDNSTLLGTFFDYTPEQRKYAFDYCGYQEQWDNQWQIGGYESTSCQAFIRTLFQSSAGLVILPIQDLCGFGNDTRMNEPGTTKNNWLFRMTKEGLSQIHWRWYKYLNQLFLRNLSSNRGQLSL